MFSESQIEQYADVMLWALDASRPSPIKPGQTVLVRFDVPGLELAEAVHRKLALRRINPVVRMNRTATMERDFYSDVSPAQLAFVAPGTRELYEDLAGSLHIIAPQELTHLKDADPMDIAAAARGAQTPARHPRPARARGRVFMDPVPVSHPRAGRKGRD